MPSKILPIENQILTIRGKQVMLDRDLAERYDVETKALNQAVKRNSERFPERNCFQLSKEEYENLKSQIVTSSWGGVRKMPFAFTEQGVAMLSAVLRSKTAIKVSLDIMDAFVATRHYMLENIGLVGRITSIEQKLVTHDQKIETLFSSMDKAAVKSKGMFYENQEFDAYVFVCDLIRKAQKRIILVDRKGSCHALETKSWRKCYDLYIQ